MADVTIYVDYDNGNDSTGDGSTGNPYKHISKALEVAGTEITDNTTIRLKGDSITSPMQYLETAGLVSIKNVRCFGDKTLTIMADEFNETNYQSVQNPFSSCTGAGPNFDVTENKPVKTPKIVVENSNGIRLVGLQVESQAAASDHGFKADLLSSVELVYCSAWTGSVGILCMNNSIMYVENAFCRYNQSGVVASFGGKVFMIGGNFIYNPWQYGIFGYDGMIAIRDWTYSPELGTVVELDAPRRKFAGVKLTIGSKLVVEDPDTNPAQVSTAALVIISKFKNMGDDFHGVVLESKSLYVGSDNTSFAVFDSEDDYVDNLKDTIPEDKQFVQKANEDTTIVP